MTGRLEIDKQRKRLDATFERVHNAIPDDAELLSDFARYFCVLVAGFLEQAMIEVALEHVRTHSAPSIQRHVDSRLRRFTSANTQNIIDLLGSFDPDWRLDLEGYLVDEYKDSINSVVSLRHTVAHGRYAGITMASVKDYYERVKDVVDHVSDLCIP
jgi:hypothetical protein